MIREENGRKKTARKENGRKKTAREENGRKEAARKEIGRTRSGLRLGYTTGSCAAGAAKAAVEMLLSGEEIRQIYLLTPAGIGLYLDVEHILRSGDRVECAVQKDGGDDPDVTDGAFVFVRAEKADFSDQESGKSNTDLRVPTEAPGSSGTGNGFWMADGRILLEGGEGVGIVTGSGLEQQPGQAAINPVPRRMITEAVLEICGQYGYEGDLRITVSVPGGAEMGKQTFNPRLGILGGISILGTSGIVEPMSEKALTETIWLEMKMLHDRGAEYCYVVPGNYGMDFLEHTLGADPGLSVKCSNYLGEALEDARLLGMKGILLVGHAGKLVKAAAGIMNTHSAQADGRMEVLASHAALAGADQDTVRRIMECINTTEAFQVIREKGLLDPVMKTVMEKISFHLCRKAGEDLETGAVVFTLEDGILGKTGNADRLLACLRQETAGGKAAERQEKIQEEEQA